MEIIQIYSNPTKYNLAPYGTVYQHDKEIFIQVSKKPEVSNWITLGNLLSAIHQKSILSDDFIKQCLDMYESLNV